MQREISAPREPTLFHDTHYCQFAPSRLCEARGRQRCAKAQAAILGATIELLKRKPLRDVTADAIAQKAGVSKATLYKWWPNKNLVALDAFLCRVERAVESPDTGSARRDFTEQLKGVMRFYASPEGKMFCQFIAEGQSDPKFLALFRERVLQSRREVVRVIWERGVARGDIRADLDKDIVLDLLYGPMIFRLLAGHAPLNDSEAEAMVAVAFDGLKTGGVAAAVKHVRASRLAAKPTRGLTKAA